jgi:hypothetical protein
MLTSSLQHSEKIRVWATTRRSVEWASAAIYAAIGTWSFLLGGYPLLGWALGLVYPFLWMSYQRHRITGTDEGIELRNIWWRQVVRWRDVSSLETRPVYGSKAILLTKRHNPPWNLIIWRGGRKIVVSTQKSVAENMHAEFERRRAAQQQMC